AQHPGKCCEEHAAPRLDSNECFLHCFVLPPMSTPPLLHMHSEGDLEEFGLDIAVVTDWRSSLAGGFNCVVYLLCNVLPFCRFHCTAVGELTNHMTVAF